MHVAERLRLLPPSRFRVVIERPVPGFPIVDASAGELRQRIDHRAAGGAHEEGELGQLVRSQFASLPDGSRRVHDQVASVLPAHEKVGALGQHQRSAVAA